jgi:predicted metal-dependent phosphotriesterase family hydrolase
MMSTPATLGQGEQHLGNVGNLLRYFVPALCAAGVADADVQRVFAGNPKRVLPIQ